MNSYNQIKQIRFVPNSSKARLLRFLKSPFLSLLLSAAAGSLIVLAFAPFAHYYVVVPSLLWLIFILEVFDKWQAYACTMFYSLGMWVFGFFWIYHSIFYYGNAGLVFTPILVGLTCFFIALLLLIMAWLYKFVASNTGLFSYIRKPMIYKISAFSAIWILVEVIREFVLKVPWFNLGNIAIDAPDFISIWLPIVGVFGTSFIIVFCIASLYFLVVTVFSWVFFGNKSFSDFFHFIPFFCFIVASAILSFMQPQWIQPTNSSMRFGLIQPNINPLEKWHTQQSYQQIFKQSLDIVDDVDVLVWPESSIAGLFSRKEASMRLIQSRLYPVPIITGSLRRNNSGTETYNSIFVLDLDKGNQIYDKQILVPFGEYVPFVKYLQFLIQIIGLPELGLEVGPKDNRILNVNGFSLLANICYEIAFSGVNAKHSRNVDALLTISDDSWFGSTIGPDQHFQMARVRAKENGRYLVRVANDGITAIVDTNGKVVSRIPRSKSGTLVANVPSFRGSTPFSVTGNWPLWAFIVVPLFMCWLFHFSNRRKISADGTY